MSCFFKLIVGMNTFQVCQGEDIGGFNSFFNWYCSKYNILMLDVINTIHIQQDLQRQIVIIARFVLIIIKKIVIIVH